MTYSAQVWHFVRFDLQRTLAWWLVYLVLLVLTPLVMFDQPLYGVLPDASRVLLPLLTWGIGMATAVLVVQADAPLSSTAFWKGKPIDNRALATAKLLMVGVVTMVATVVAVIAWRAVGMPRHLIMPTLQQAVPAYLALVLFASLLGVVTRSLASTLLMWVGFLIFVAIGIPLLFFAARMPNAAVPLTALSGGAWTSVGSAAMAVNILAVVSVYRMRTPNGLRRAWLLAGTLLLGATSVGTLCAVAFVRPSEKSISYEDRIMMRVTADAPASMPETVRFDSLPHRQVVEGSVPPFTVVGARRDRRYELQQLRLTPFDGRGIGGRMIALSTSPLGVSPAVFDIDSTLKRIVTESDGIPLPADRSAVSWDSRANIDLDSVRTIALEGIVVRYRAERVRVVPFAPGVVFADSMVTIQLSEGRNGVLALEWTSFGNVFGFTDINEGSFPLSRDFAFAVVDSAHRTVRQLGSSSGFSSSDWMVLPGAFRSFNGNHLDDQPALRALLAKAGQGAASIVVYKWVEDGRRRVRQTLPVDWTRRPPGRRRNAPV